MESFVPMTTNQDLTAVLTCPRNVTTEQWIWNFLISTSEVICKIRLLLFPSPPKIMSWSQTILSFLLLITSLPLSPPTYKNHLELINEYDTRLTLKHLYTTNWKKLENEIWNKILFTIVPFSKICSYKSNKRHILSLC